MRRGNGTIRMAVAFAALFASLSMVVWRQSRALDELRALDEARSERTLLQAELSALQREIQYLESRPRVVAVAAEMLDMRVPTQDEMRLRIAPVREAPSFAGSAGRPLLSAADGR